MGIIVDCCEMSDVLLYGIWFSEEQLGRINNIELYCRTDSRTWWGLLGT